MPRSGPRLSILLLMLALPAVLAARCSMRPNVPFDLDGNGYFETIYASDYDGDGRLEIVDDVQAALNALNDPGPKLLVIGPGTFLPPVSCPIGSACWCRLMPRYNSGGISCYSGYHDPRGHALLQIPSNTTVNCTSRFETVLAAWDYNDPNAADANFAVIGNAGYANGNRNITIEDCGWRGGGRYPYNSAAWTRIGRRGLDFQNVEDALIRNNYASYFQHAGIFVESSRRVVIRDNTLERDSGYGNLALYASQSSIYIHNDPVAPATSDITIEYNTVLDPGGNAISLRNDYQDSGKLIERVVMRGNSVYSHGTGSCMLMRASHDIEVRDYYCDGTNFGLQLDPAATAFGAGNSNDNVLFDGLTLVNIVAPSGGAALTLPPYHSNVSFRNLVIDRTTGGTNSDCVAVRPPFRNVSIQGFLLARCGGHGINFYSLAPSIVTVGRTPDERLVVSDGEIRDVDAYDRRDWSLRSGIRFGNVGARYLVLHQISIDGVTAHGIEVAPGMRIEDSLINGLDISRVPPGFRGIGPKASHALFCDAASNDDWIAVTNALSVSDCNLAGPTGVTRVRCRCEDGALKPVTNHVVGHAIWLQGGLVRGNWFSNLYLHDNAGPTADFAFQIDGATPVQHSGNHFENIDISDTLMGLTYGLRLAPGGSNATNTFSGIHCMGSAAARCLEGVPPGAVVLP